jgi:O-antigen/teichoic acid export membrane protein
MSKLYSKIQSFKKNKDNKELVLNSGIALFVRVLAAIATFGMNIVIARILGASEAGYCFQMITVTTLLVMFGRISSDPTILRFVSVHSALGEWNKVHSLVAKMARWTVYPLTVLAIIVCVFAKQISVSALHKPAFQWPLFWGAISMPFFALCNVYAMALQGMKKVFLSVTALKILTPLFVIVLVLVFPPKDSAMTSIYYIIACVINLVFAYYWWIRAAPRATEKYVFDSRLLWQSSFPLWVTAVMNQTMVWGGQFVAGFYNSPKELAQLAVARSTSVLITFILTAVNYVSAPRFATLYNQGKMVELKRYAHSTSWLMTIIATPVVLVIWFFPGLIMSMFGKDFVSGIWLLRVLSIGQFINVITGSTGYLLVMSGNEKDIRNINIINAILAIGLAFILNPIYGPMGSAMSTAIVLITSNLMAAFWVKKRLGFSPIVLSLDFITDRLKRDPKSPAGE